MIRAFLRTARHVTYGFELDFFRFVLAREYDGVYQSVRRTFPQTVRPYADRILERLSRMGKMRAVWKRSLLECHFHGGAGITIN